VALLTLLVGPYVTAPALATSEVRLPAVLTVSVTIQLQAVLVTSTMPPGTRVYLFLLLLRPLLRSLLTR
jgi:hypothetical protein